MSNDQSPDNQPNLPSHIAYSVEEGRGDKSHWNKIGAAWPTKGDGLSLKLNALPVDGNVVLRSREELDRLRAERSAHQDGSEVAQGATGQVSTPPNQPTSGNERQGSETSQSVQPKM